MRKLASIQKIIALDHIVGADVVEIASVYGWQLVVKKGEFKVGVWAVYFEIDSLIPNRPVFKFLKPRNMHIKTANLIGQISRGICFSLSILPNNFEITEDADCMDVLGIMKYEPPIPASFGGIAKGKFPSFIPKTDETRVQVFQEMLDTHRGEKCYIIEKLDESSATYNIRDGELGVYCRNLELLEEMENSFWKVARQMEIKNKLRLVSKKIDIQGELIGQGIQSNKYYLRGQPFRFFSFFDIDGYKYLNFFNEFNQIMDELQLPIVPFVSLDYELENDIEAIVRKATIKSMLMLDIWAEGFVIRPCTEELEPSLSNEYYNSGRVSFKAINPEFLFEYVEKW